MQAANEFHTPIMPTEILSIISSLKCGLLYIILYTAYVDDHVVLVETE